MQISQLEKEKFSIDLFFTVAAQLPRVVGCGATPHKHNVQSERGELENSSVNCFLKRAAFPTGTLLLQERASPKW